MKEKFEKILVIGSNSFSGSHFINYALENGSKIIGISRSPESNPIFLPYYNNKLKSERFRFFQLDLNKDSDKVLELIEQEKPEVIAIYAGLSEVKSSWDWADQYFEINTLAPMKIAKFLIGKEYLKKFLVASTPEVYGSTDEEIKENNTYSPNSPYAISKSSLDQYLHILFKKYEFPVVFTRAANIYGSHQKLFRIIPKTIISLKKGEKIKLNNAGRSKRAFINIKDVIEGSFKVLQKAKSGEIYHLAPSGEIVTIKELVKKVCDIMGYDFDKMTEIGEINKSRDSIYSLSSEKAMTELDWKPRVSLEAGIKETIKWIEDNWSTIKEMSLEYEHKA